MRASARSASTSGASGSPSAPNSMHWPVSMQNPAADPSAASSPTRRVLPTPASPPISATAGSPRSARRTGAASNSNSSRRPMKTGLTTLTLIARTLPQAVLPRSCRVTASSGGSVAMTRPPVPGPRRNHQPGPRPRSCRRRPRRGDSSHCRDELPPGLPLTSLARTELENRRPPPRSSSHPRTPRRQPAAAHHNMACPSTSATRARAPPRDAPLGATPPPPHVRRGAGHPGHPGGDDQHRRGVVGEPAGVRPSGSPSPPPPPGRASRRQNIARGVDSRADQPVRRGTNSDSCRAARRAYRRISSPSSGEPAYRT